MTTATLTLLRNLEYLYEHGFRDNVTDAALQRVAAGQAARDEAVLHELERDLEGLEEQYSLTSEEFFRRWQAGELGDAADFTDWSALYQMSTSIRQRLELLRLDATASYDNR